MFLCSNNCPKKNYLNFTLAFKMCTYKNILQYIKYYWQINILLYIVYTDFTNLKKSNVIRIVAKV